MAEDSKYKLFSSNGSEDQDTVKDKLEYKEKQNNNPSVKVSKVDSEDTGMLDKDPHLEPDGD